MYSLHITRKQLRVPLTSLKKNKLSVPALDEVALEKLRKYYRFEREEELLEFLKIQCMHD
ncbi:MAG: hypothetical protein QN785_00055 [Nitrososphaeraceae archaeon]|nr:hypothetical protein [Nitrososphaeraceae archaeon]